MVLLLFLLAALFQAARCRDQHTCYPADHFNYMLGGTEKETMFRDCKQLLGSLVSKSSSHWDIWGKGSKSGVNSIEWV